MEKPVILYNQSWFVILCFFSLFFIFLYAFDYSTLNGRESSRVELFFNSFASFVNTPKPYSQKSGRSEATQNISHSSHEEDSCLGHYIYVHDLPSQFNDDVLKNCTSLIKWFDMCPYVTNLGLGPQINYNYNNGAQGIPSETSWFATNQFVLEIIFRNRMKNYKCLTNDSSMASVIYVPFYAGFDVGRYLWGYNTTVRDSLAMGVTKWVSEKPEWRRMMGRDHFFVSGRIAWDFWRQSDNDSDWGSKLMSLPESMNMTMLSIESTSWSNEFAVPYPTYFHPSRDADVFQWQDKVRSQERRHLFSFAGAARPNMDDSIRSEIINQCLDSGGSCYFLDCHSGHHKCDDPIEVINVLQESIFCLQPPGDSYTRRSTFDSILSGCIPVFFHPGSAYAQYTWHLPKNYTKYSVFIPMNLVKDRKVSIKDALLKVPREEVLAIREEVIRLIPKVIYGNPKSKLEGLEDAFDIAVKGVIKRVEKLRRDQIEEGKDENHIGFAKENSWKVKLDGSGKENDWESLF